MIKSNSCNFRKYRREGNWKSYRYKSNQLRKLKKIQIVVLHQDKDHQIKRRRSQIHQQKTRKTRKIKNEAPAQVNHRLADPHPEEAAAVEAAAVVVAVVEVAVAAAVEVEVQEAVRQKAVKEAQVFKA